MKRYKLTPSNTIPGGANIKLDYTRGAVKSTINGFLQSFTDEIVINNALINAPLITNVYTDDNGEFIYVTFDREMDEPGVGSFSEFDYLENATPGTFTAISSEPFALGEVYWEYTLSAGSSSSPAIGADGTVYVCAGDGLGGDSNVYAFNPGGSLLWDLYAGDELITTPVVDSEGVIYVVSSDGHVGAVNPSGIIKWSVLLDVGIRAPVAIAANGNVIVGSYTTNKVYALDPADGSEIWSYTATDILQGGPSIDSSGNIYIGCADGLLYSLTSAGVFRWSYDLTEPTSSIPAIDSTGTVYIGAGNGLITAVTTAGAEKWTITTTAGVANTSGPAIAADDTIYYGSGDGFVYALDPVDGSEIWSYDTGYPISSGITVGSTGHIYVSNNNGDFITLTSMGVLVRSFAMGGEAHMAPPLVPFQAGGLAYITSTAGKIHAVHVESAGLAVSDWPKSGYNNSNIGNAS